MFCINCGKELKDTARFCPFCGNKIETPAEKIKNENVSMPVTEEKAVTPAERQLNLLRRNHLLPSRQRRRFSL